MTTNSNRFSLGVVFMTALSFSSLRMKRTDDGFSILAHAFHTRTLGPYDCLQTADGRVDLVVDDDILVLRVLVDLRAGDLEPPPNLVLGVLAATAQTLLQHVSRRRQHKNANGLDSARTDLTSALDIDYEDNVFAAREHRLGIRRGSAVVVPEHVRPFEKLALADHGFEPLACNEIIVDPVLLADSGGTGRVGT